MALNTHLGLSFKYNKRIKPLKRTKLSRLILTGPNFLLQCEQKTLSCQKPVACCTRCHERIHCFGSTGEHQAALSSTAVPSRREKSLRVQVSRDGRKRSGKVLCQNICSENWIHFPGKYCNLLCQGMEELFFYFPIETQFTMYSWITVCLSMIIFTLQ